MFNIGGGEMMLLAILALLVFGPEGLPEIIKTVTRTVRAFRQAATDFQSEVSTALTVENQKRDVEQRRRRRSAPTETQPALAETASGTVEEASDSQPHSEVGETALVLSTSQALVTTETAKDEPQVESPSALDQPGEEAATPPAAVTVPYSEAAAESTSPAKPLGNSSVPSEAVAPVVEDDDGPGLPMVKKPLVVESDTEPSPSLESVS